MIIRIVKMSFAPEKVNEFLLLFNSSKKEIRHFPGCTHLELLNDRNSPEVFFTYSHWEKESDLENYRNSSLFAGVWSQTKVLFNDKPLAWSLERHITVD
jgi:(4S)-4-hydroxy-5-phosphonooxypentane-2,3-dione isomerase